MTAPKLLHYTCRHSTAGIEAAGLLQPNRHPALPTLEPLVWLTDDPALDALALGLANLSGRLTCDRTEARYTVPAGSAAVRWVDYRRPLRRSPWWATVDLLESSPGALPLHWWVSTEPLAVARTAEWAAS